VEAGGELHVEVVPWGPDMERAREAVNAVLEGPDVADTLGDGARRVVSMTPLVPDPEGGEQQEPTHIRATVYDYARERTVLVDAPLDDGGDAIVESRARQPLPATEEREAAIDVISDDPELGPALREGRLVAYAPMPPFIADELPDGRIERTIAVGLRPVKGGEGHEILGVKLGRRELVRFERGAPPGSLAAPQTCGLPDAGQATVQGVPGAAKVTVSQGGTELWRFVAIRPAASSGTNGSGIELRAVAYRGKRVLRRAHVPILNVRYDGDACGPYRDWQDEEGRLDATGDDVAPGFRLCPAPAQTILESGDDHGNFRGTAVYVDDEEVVLVCEMHAGWYRYVSYWRFDADGTIRPRFGFGAVDSSCVCNRHHHHAYWRLDFDVVDGVQNGVREFNDPPVSGTSNWHTLEHEIRRERNPQRQRRWRVVNREGDESYTLVPGPSDGTADGFGIGDLWALRKRDGESDDGVGFTTDPQEARAHLNRFLTGQPISRADVVLWYAAHFAHDVHDEDGVPHIVGPDLEPGGW
jgi:Copper amine oxidase, enzyme domain